MNAVAADENSNRQAMPTGTHTAQMLVEALAPSLVRTKCPG